MSKQCTKPKRKRDDSWFKDKVLLVQAQANGQILHEKELAFLADLEIAKVALMANLSHYGSDALVEVHNPDNVDNNMINQGVQVMPSSEQSNVVNQSETKITSDSNIIPYSQKGIFNANSYSSKNNFKKEESRNIDREIVLEKKIKQLNNIVYKRYQSAQTVHMLTKPRFFYDHSTKQVLGFQNPFYLNKAQQLELKLYDGNVITNTYTIVIPDSKETLMLAEESQPNPSKRTTKVKVLKELPKVNMDIVNIVVNSSVDNASMNMHECKKCLELETELLNKKDFIEKETHNKLFKSYTTLEKRCISLEVDTQLNQDIFQRDNSVSNQSAPCFDQYFALNELKAQSQEKDTIISKLKERIKSLSGNVNVDKVKKDIEEIETINIEMDHRVSKLIAENEHLKQAYKQLYGSIKPTCEQGLIIAALRDELRKLKGKAIVDNTEQAVILRKVVEQGKSQNPLNNSLDHAWFTTWNDLDTTYSPLGVDLLTGSQDNNLYTLSLEDMMASSPICLLSKVSKTKSWLWHGRLSHLNFVTINHLARHDLVRGLPKLKFKKDHLCSACAMGKSKKKPHTPKYEDTNHEKLYLLHMDLSSPMHVTSVNGKKYILIIVNDYSRFTWQNGVVERRNHTLIEAARTMLIYAKASLFLWAEAVVIRELEQVTTESRYCCSRTAALTYSPSSTTVDLEAPSPSDSQTSLETQSHVISNDVEEENHDLDVAHINNNLFFGDEESPKTPTFRDDPLHESLHEDLTSQGSSSNMRQNHTLFESLGRWTKDHPIANMIGNPSRSVTNRKQLQTNAMCCFFVPS
nr:retrovirus-related Pol polyprotein from transposon TNT 1-94 [Tanacetum cinerariifolium]